MHKCVQNRTHSFDLKWQRQYCQVSGLEHEMEVQKEDYEKKLFELSSRLESIETGMKNAEEKEEEKNNKDKARLDSMSPERRILALGSEPRPARGPSDPPEEPSGLGAISVPASFCSTW